MAFDGFPPRPNIDGYTPVPNTFFEEVLPNINNMSELKILLAVFRKTYGWVKEIDTKTGQPIYKLEDAISYSQFHKLTGLSDTSISNGINKAIADGYLEKLVQGNQNTISKYGLRLEDKPKKEIPPAKEQSISETPSQQESKDDLIAELLGKKKEEKKEDNISPHKRVVKLWFRYYFQMFNMKYNMTGKDHAHIKSLLREYSYEQLEKAIDFYFRNYNKIEGVPAEYPALNIFYGFRRKIIPTAIMGDVKREKESNREFDNTKFEEDDFFD